MPVVTPEEYAAIRRRKQAAARQKKYRQNHPDRVKAYEAYRRQLRKKEKDEA